MMKSLQINGALRKSDAEKVRDFQRKIYQKAKQEAGFRFYVMYDKVRLPHFLREAYRRVKANDGVSGMDGISFDYIENYGVERYLTEIQKELESKTYKASPVKRVHIPKGNGKTRPLGIPTIKDRIVQMSCKLVIEPIFEADFEESSYGFRPERSAADAIKAIKQLLDSGKNEVLDADLSSYFDTIPHAKLLKIVGQRISDKNILHLLKMWLKAPIWDERAGGSAKKNKKGTPQGGVISPLLANIYLHLVDRLVNKVGCIFQNYGVKIVRYADDFVLIGHDINKAVLEKLQSVLGRMELILNREKTKLVSVRTEPFDFLGFTLRYDKDLYGSDRKYLNIVPSKKSQKKVREKLSECLRKNSTAAPQELSKELNKIIRGWSNYFGISGVSYPKKAQRDMRYYLAKKLRRYYSRKSQRPSKLVRQRAFDVLVANYGLIDPSKCCI